MSKKNSECHGLDITRMFHTIFGYFKFKVLVPVSVTLSHTQSYTDTLKSKSGLNHTKISEKSLKNLTEKSQSRPFV